MTGWSWHGTADNTWADQWSRFLPYLLVATGIFGIGLLFGTLATQILTGPERVQLTNVLHTLLSWETQHIGGTALYRPALLHNVKVLGLVYLLGISVAGIPLVLAVLFFRGFVVGFAITFLSQIMTAHGIEIAIATVVAQNLFMIPLYILAGTLALWFSWNLLSARAKPDRVPVWRALANYTLASAALAAAMFWATAIEVWGSPLLLHLSQVAR